jgi:hypothetical protein
MFKKLGTIISAGRWVMDIEFVTRFAEHSKLLDSGKSGEIYRRLRNAIAKNAPIILYIELSSD